MANIIETQRDFRSQSKLIKQAFNLIVSTFKRIYSTFQYDRLQYSIFFDVPLKKTIEKSKIIAANRKEKVQKELQNVSARWMFNANSEGDKTAKIHGKVWFIKNNKLTSLFINPILVNLVNFAVEMNLDFLNINGNLSIRAPVDDCFTINFQFPIRESKNIEQIKKYLINISQGVQKTIQKIFKMIENNGNQDNLNIPEVELFQVATTATPFNNNNVGFRDNQENTQNQRVFKILDHLLDKEEQIPGRDITTHRIQLQLQQIRGRVLITNVFDVVEETHRNDLLVYRRKPNGEFKNYNEEPISYLRFEREIIYLLRNIGHQNLGQFYLRRKSEGDEFQDQVYSKAYSKQFLDFVKSEKPNSNSFFKKLISIALQIVSVLQYLYDKEITHKDIKPQNILIDQNNKVKIIDVGGMFKISDLPEIFRNQPNPHKNIDNRNIMETFLRQFSTKQYSFCRNYETLIHQKFDMFGMGKVYQKMFPTSIPENYENTLYHRYMSTLLQKIEQCKQDPLTMDMDYLQVQRTFKKIVNDYQ